LPALLLSENVVALITETAQKPLAAVLPLTPAMVTTLPLDRPWAAAVVITIGLAFVALVTGKALVHKPLLAT
jgi:hypothetical protein